MILAMPILICICGVGVILNGSIRSTLKASSIILLNSTVNRVYCENLTGFENSLSFHRGRMARGVSLPILWISMTFVLNSCNSSNYINFVARCLSSSILPANFLQKLSEKDPGFRVVTRWWGATSWLRFRILRATLPNLSMIDRSVSDFSCQMLTRAREVKWWCLLVGN